MNVLVLCGGKSAERDISCVSAAAILRNLRPPYRPILVHIDSRGRWRYQRDPGAFARYPRPFRFPFQNALARLEPGNPAARGCGGSAKLRVGSRSLRVDVVFPALHGPFGEDGTLQGYLDVIGVPYVGCDVLGSAASMDKAMTKRLALQAGLPVLPYVVLERIDPIIRTRDGDARGISVAGAAEEKSLFVRGMRAARRLEFPVFVKPCRLGSSIGVYKVNQPAGLAAAVRKAFRFDTTVIVEQGVPAREIECAVLGAGRAYAPGTADKDVLLARGGDVRASIAGEIRPNAEFYSYEAKYLDPNGAQLIIPAEIPPRRMREVRNMAVRAFRALGCYGLARVDFLLDRRTGKLWFNEANTMPGFTSISMYPRLWEASGLPFDKLTDRLIKLALSRHRRRARLRPTRD